MAWGLGSEKVMGGILELKRALLSRHLTYEEKYVKL